MSLLLSVKAAGNATDYPWKDKAVLRFPLPSQISNCYLASSGELTELNILQPSEYSFKLTLFSSVEGLEDELRNPPCYVKISIFSKQFFNDTKLGDAFISLENVTSERLKMIFSDRLNILSQLSF